MAPPPKPGSRRISLLVAVVLGLFAVAVVTPLVVKNTQKTTGPDEADDAALAPPDQTYTVRGRITALPTDDVPDLMIAHEEIPDFVNQAGETVGMRAMVMPFTPADNLDLTGLKPDTPVEFTFEVRWQTSPRTLVTRIDPLPPASTPSNDG